MASKLASRFCRGLFVLRQGILTKQHFGVIAAKHQSLPLIGNFQQHRLASSNASPLADFLENEIKTEKQIAKRKSDEDRAYTRPPEGFKCQTEDANIILSRSYNKEEITVKFNVNNTIMDGAYHDDAENAEEGGGALVAKPDFKVEVAKGTQKLVFMCSFPNSDDALSDEERNQGQAREEDLDYPFQLDEIWIENKGDNDDQLYSVNCGVMDSELYDQLIAYIGERGINAEFAQQLQAFATHYEHAQYVSLLQNIKDFVLR